MTALAETQTGSVLQHEHVLASGGVRLHLVRSGEGPAVILLHGFPEFWFSWRYQIPALAAADFCAVAPDMRGYNHSDKPKALRDYDIEHLVADVAALAERYGNGRAHLVGHDWGGIVAWYAAMLRPDCFEKLVILNAPHPAAFARDFWSTRQWMHSLYMFFFQIPGLPEKLIQAGRGRVLREMFLKEVRNPDAFAHGEIESYVDAMLRSGAATGGLNYYRAAFRRRLRNRQEQPQKIEIPTLLLWGEKDPYLRVSLTEGLEQWVPKLTVRRFPNASHWLQLDEPETVSQLMIEFFGSSGRG